MEFFLNPWFMAAGGALVSSPIIIHLINRMRFKRIRWAAMEFLLKSQKRNRRRLIIEQLILLLLRVLMILLVGLLVARWIYGGNQSSTGTKHIIVIDDSLSMRDRHKDDRGDHTAWSTAREQVMLLVKNAALANSTQEMTVLLLSDLEHPIFDERLGDKSEEKIGKILAEKQPTYLHLSPLDGLATARKALHDSPHGQKMLHFVGDFRESDFDAGADADKIKQEVASAVRDQPVAINVSLIDTAHPSRKLTRGVASGHDNLAIVDLKPSSRVVAEGVDVTFTVTIVNFGRAEKQDVGLEVYIDDQVDYRGTKTFRRILPGLRFEEKFTLSFQKKKNGPEFARVRAEIKTADSPLEADDVRDVVVDVRKRVPILVIDGNGFKDPEKEDPQFDRGDWRTLVSGLAAGKAYEPRRELVSALETLELSEFPTIYLLDVKEISNKVILDRLQHYVEKGGNLVYFLGPRTQASWLNELHTKRNGLFPILIDKPIDLLDVLLGADEARKNALITWVQKNEAKKDPSPDDLRRLMRRVWIQGWDPMDDLKPDDDKPPRLLQGKILFRDQSHPFVSKDAYGLASLPTYYYDNLLINYYYRAQPTANWQVPPKEVAEVVTMPQIRSSVTDFKERAVTLAQQVIEKTDAVADRDAEYNPQKTAVRTYARYVRLAVDGDEKNKASLAALDRVLERMLEEGPDERNPNRADMPKLWGRTEMRALRDKLTSLRDEVRFGDGLVYARRYQSGNKDDRSGYTVVVLTTAGTASDKPGAPRWNEWGNGPAQWTYPNFMRPMQAFLNSQGDTLNRVLDPKDRLEVSFDKTRYEPDVKVTFIPQERPKTAEGQPAAAPKPRELRSHRLELKKDDRLWLTFADAREPGVYTFELKPLKGGEADVLAVSYNVDAEAEGNLARSPSETLERKDLKDAKGKVKLFSAGDPTAMDEFKNREPDLSERFWLYLVLLLVLVAEQAMAVHLSHHLKGAEGTAAPEAAPAVKKAAAA